MATNVSAPDLSQMPPRSGRELLGGYAWLARLADKVRAEHAGTQGDYVGYCGMSMAYLDAVGVSKDEFDRIIRDGASDDDLVRYFNEHVDAAHKDAANRAVLEDMADHIAAQDAEEGRA